MRPLTAPSEVLAGRHRTRRAIAARRHRLSLPRDGREPSLPAHIASSVVGVIGLDDLAERGPRIRTAEPAPAPNASLGANCCALAPNDLIALYSNATGYDGTGQTIVIAGAYAWKDTDNSTFATQWALPALPVLTRDWTNAVRGAAKPAAIRRRGSVSSPLRRASAGSHRAPRCRRRAMPPGDPD
jgi:hypothetical protein